MKELEDAFGRALYDCFLGKSDCEIIIERDDGYIDLDIDTNKYFAEIEDWEPHYREAMKYAKGRILDVGCGAGRHSLYLQDMGFEVVGIDISPKAIETCRSRGLLDARVMSINEISSKLGRFDTILMLGNNFGLFGSYIGAKSLLKKFHSITNKHARIIAETRDIYQTSNPFHLEYHDLNRRRNRMPGQLRIRARYKKYATPWFNYLMVSKSEMEQIVKGTGWKIDHFIDTDSSNYIAIIESEKG